MSAVLSRFQKFVAPQPSGCWHWTGAKNTKGYGLVLDHLCRNPCCVNPEHLEPGTLAENVKRGDHVAKGWKRHITHCPKGHEYTPENTYVERATNERSKRHCKVCMAKRKGEQS